MRKRLVAWMLVLFLLSGCNAADNGMQRCLEFRTQVLKRDRCCFTMEVGADYETEVVHFSGQYCCSEEAGTELSLTQPETLAGIRVNVKHDSLQLVFDDVQVAIPPLAEDSLPPLAAGAVFYECWKNGEILRTETTGGELRMSAEDTFGTLTLRVDTWLDSSTLSPLRGQIAWEDTVVVTATFTDVDF